MEVTTAQLRAFAFILGDTDAVAEIDAIASSSEDDSLQVYYTKQFVKGDEEDYVVEGSDEDNGALWEIYKAGYRNSDGTVSGNTYWNYYAADNIWECEDSEYLEPIEHLMPHEDVALFK